MTGLIWFVQIVHYPMLARYPAAMFPGIAREHCDRTGFVVGPLMLVEAASGGLCLLAGVGEPVFLLSLGLLALIWLSTAAVQVPLHRRLLREWDPRAAGRLSRTNWVRTVAWTLRSACVALVFL